MQVGDGVGWSEEVSASLRDWSEGLRADRNTCRHRSLGGNSAVGQRLGDDHSAWRPGLAGTSTDHGLRQGYYITCCKLQLFPSTTTFVTNTLGMCKNHSMRVRSKFLVFERHSKNISFYDISARIWLEFWKFFIPAGSASFPLSVRGTLSSKHCYRLISLSWLSIIVVVVVELPCLLCTVVLLLLAAAAVWVDTECINDVYCWTWERVPSGYKRCCSWCCCYQIFNVLKLFNFTTDRNETSATDCWQYYQFCTLSEFPVKCSLISK